MGFDQSDSHWMDFRPSNRITEKLGVPVDTSIDCSLATADSSKATQFEGSAEASRSETAVLEADIGWHSTITKS